MANPYTSSYGKMPQLYDVEGLPVDMDAITAAQNMPDTEMGRFLARKAHRTEMATNLGAATLAGGAQLATTFWKTPQDRENAARLADLERRRAAGRLGQNAQEDAFIEASSMNPVRSFAAQQTQRGEAERASVGATRSARQALESERIGRQQVTEAAGKVGLQKAQRFLERKAAEEKEIQQRIAYESEKQKNRLEMIGQTISGLAGLAGKYAAGAIQETITPDQLNEYLAKHPELQNKDPKDVLSAYKAWRGASKKGDLSKSEATMAGAETSGTASASRAGSDWSSVIPNID